MQGGLLLLQTKQSKIKLTQNTQKPQTIPVNSRMVARGGAAPRPAHKPPSGKRPDKRKNPGCYGNLAVLGDAGWSSSPSGHKPPSGKRPDKRKNPGCCGNLAVLGDAGWSSPVARQAHNLKVTGSNPVPATKLKSNAVHHHHHRSGAEPEG
jgi:hypothetical protein